MEQPGRAKQWEVSGTARWSNSGRLVEQPGGQTVGGEWNSQGGPNSGR